MNGIKEQLREIADKFTKDMNRIIDGYTGEYEQPKELLQGAVVCYESDNKRIMLQYKKYIFNNGRTNLECGRLSGVYSTIEDWNKQNNSFKIARLIEDEGEK